MSAQESEKATRYIGLLNGARLNGSWSDVPELVRKVEKHAPHRKCLVLSATTETQLATGDKARTSTANATFLGLQDAASRLPQAIEQEKGMPEDSFQAAVALQHLHFSRQEYKSVLAVQDTGAWRKVAGTGRHTSGLSGVTALAMIKSSYLSGYSHEQHEGRAQANETYASALSSIELVPKDVSDSAEYRLWTEKLLSRSCALAVQDSSAATLGQSNQSLLQFRAWSRFWETASGRSTSVAMNQAVARRQVWGSYYHLLSTILASEIEYSSSAAIPLTTEIEFTSPEARLSSRLRQRGELKRVEATYETLLINETKFPNAQQSNEEVERWTNQVMDNWRIFCGPTWLDAEVDGGKESVGRGVLEILYRAATKTFHSTPILRHLFSVHASLAEFDIAIKAFDSYTEFVSKGKARAEKTGVHELGLDTDDQVLLTAADAINVLCLYGSREQAEKALDIGKRLSGWLLQQKPSTSPGAEKDLDNPRKSDKASTESEVSSPTLSVAYRGIGQSQANWARYTYDTQQRTEYRQKALSNLRHSAQIADVLDSATAFLLATVLAESRDVPAGIKVLKAALASPTSSLTTNGAAQTSALARAREQVPLWHLLALLLTAKGEYEIAIKMCEAAFEQLDQATAGSASAASSDSLATLEAFEKENLMQVKMTEIGLLALLENSSIAADRGPNLLSLYARLFGNPEVTPRTLQTSASKASMAPPPSSAGTLRSIRGSILGRPKSARISMDKSTFDPPSTQPDTPVTIPVTDSEGKPAESHHKHHIPHHPFKHLVHHHDNAVSGATTQGQMNEKTVMTDDQTPPDVPPKDAQYINNSNATTTQGHPAAIAGSVSPNSAAAPDQPLRPVAHNIDPEKQGPPAGHSDQPPQQDVRLPAPHPISSQAPATSFSTLQKRRRSISQLIEIWLLVADLYIREELYSDAQSAGDEAFKLTDSLQSDVAATGSSARSFDERGWGAGRSISRLIADVWASRGRLALAQLQSHDALAHFEQALSHFPDHPSAIVGLSTILLDIYEQKIPSEPTPAPLDPRDQTQSTSSVAVSSHTTPAPQLLPDSSRPTTQATPTSTNRFSEPSPAELNRLAARDRAYMLLSTLTKLGSGWDDAEAWFVLSRAYELSGQVDKAKECLWWVVELEDARPVRPWSVVGAGIA